MAASDASPISQLLNSLGLTREDLHKRSDEMRQFLTADNPSSSRVLSRGRADSSSSISNLRSLSRSQSTAATSARSRSRASSISYRDDASPSPSPVKAEPVESGLPPRQLDTMEAVLERHRLARKEKRQRKEKERDMSRVSQSSPTPSNASSRGKNLGSLSLKREELIIDARTGRSTSLVDSEPPPLTPSQTKYYREHTAAQGLTVIPKAESPAVKTVPPQATHHYPYSRYLAQAELIPSLQNPHTGSSVASFPPFTPQNKRTLPPSQTDRHSPLLPLSPPLATPQASPIRIVNIVSSPGPMGPEPEEESYSRLPYTLPPGPYSPNKPDLSYAALLGQAILSSSDHRLTLQEIYDWITIVYPYFKRGETTWMNSIRHVLSTTACFRKVIRDRSLGRTQWAVWDEDLECFKNGGFRKQFCKDMNGGKSPAEVMQAKTGKRTRKPQDVEGSAERKGKKLKRETDHATGPQRTILPASHTVFPPVQPAPQTQTYYDTCAQSHNSSADVLFPPIPTLGTRQLAVNPSVTTSSISQPDGDDAVPQSSPGSDVFPPPSSASTSSVPELTPNCSSSSPPPTTSDMELDAPIIIRNNPRRDRPAFGSSGGVFGIDSSSDDDLDSDDDGLSNTKLTPVQFWGSLPRRKDANEVKPGLKLKLTINHGNVGQPDLADLDQDQPLLNAVKSKNAKQKRAAKSNERPDSPARKTSTKGGRLKAAEVKVYKNPRLKTPPRAAATEVLSTPPPNRSRKVQLSPMHTPLSHKGLHMSPSASLAHYKMNLDPPPVASYSTNEDELVSAFLHTPLRGPVTPKRLLEESPYRTSFISPFRTPGSRLIIDDHDPRALLDEELNRMSAGQNDSPPSGGLFGKQRELLYDSPNAMDASPGKWGKWSRW
ncbi:hypothetical protein E1B28_007258 [Marasmius oreades]|uniref:Fork-head domain-containing protein n=1 Tax=Marasmius oreades TaxID=181124 RepID=A0A9P7S1Y1_9AGAR|nr:uncharacterized protein E1B28_007258 [Marasmius oreades]KAG7093592.1 hypothetical protein E1B28_007258 [Marasmius oreades]